jgi:hypothetical protein
VQQLQQLCVLESDVERFDIVDPPIRIAEK